MAIIPLPAKFGFTDVSKFGLARATNVLRSRYTGQAQRIVYPYAIWHLKATLVDYDGPEAAAIRSFFAQLEGQKNTFRLPVPGFVPTPGHTGYAAVSNAGAPARATSMPLYGMGANVKEGDFFTIADELKICTSNVAMPGGSGTITFMPPLRKAVGYTQLINFYAPTVMLQSTDDDVASWGIKPPFRHGLQLDAIEAIEI
jgi:hypothetical protein